MLKSILLATALTLPIAGQAATVGSFSDLVVFGDSLSDADVPGLPLAFFPGGQVTNGQTWAAQLGADAESGTNFAQAGATAAFSDDGIDDFSAQIDSFLLDTPDLGAHPLVAIWFGGNDVAAALEAEDPAARIAEGVGAVGAGLQRLIAAGFSDFLIFGVPDVSDTPRFQDLAAGIAQVDPEAAAGLTFAAAQASLGFGAAVQGIISTIPPAVADIAFVDAFALGQNAASNPEQFGFSNVDDACFVAPDDFCGFDAADSYFYYDSFHPTERAHSLIADAARDAAVSLAPVPLPASAAFGIMGLAALGLMRRRR